MNRTHAGALVDRPHRELYYAVSLGMELNHVDPKNSRRDRRKRADARYPRLPGVPGSWPREGTVIEGGISALGPLLAVQLKQLGVASDYLRQVVITHAHPDHVMAIPALRAMFPGLSVLASAAAARDVERGESGGFLPPDRRRADGRSVTSRAAIAESPHRSPWRRTVSPSTAWCGKETSSPWTTFPGSYWKRRDTAIAASACTTRAGRAGDFRRHRLLSPESGTWWPNYFSSYAGYVRSMERLAALDAEILCLSHNGGLVGREDVRAYFAAAIAATREYHQRIVTETRAGKTVRQLAERLGAEIHRQTPVLPLDFFQKNCGMLVKQSLKHEGVSP